MNLRRGVETKSNQLSIWLRWIAIVILGLLVAFLLFMGIGEMAGGDSSGIAHLLTALVGIGLMLLALKRPWIGGSILLVLGILNILRFSGGFRPAEFLSAGVQILDLPLLLPGLFFLVIAWLDQSRNLEQQPEN